ncbi:MAG: DUF115 domain-containing protein [Treponema sp.]|nr:DUF115 domain-containing protein [Treponema sp.]
MNSIWNNNIILLQNRFPQLYELYQSVITKITQTDDVQQLSLFPFWHIEQAKNGMITAREGNLLLHSAYNPEREIQQIIAKALQSTHDTAVFLGFGIGYLPIAFAKTFPTRELIIIEPDILHFFASLLLADWSAVLTHDQCILAVGCPTQTALALIEKSTIHHCDFYAQQNQTMHAAPYFAELQRLIERNKQKEAINTNTLDRFAGLWLKNSCRNLHQFVTGDGIHIYKDMAKNIPSVVLAAGPSLEAILPHLVAIKNKAIIICVDTALRACLRYGVEPDFIILVDPQYWAAQHIAGLHAPHSVLITESAAYPTVYRFPCRKIVSCSSLFPLGQYFEKKLGSKGTLQAGGSVATSAWDFARYIGSPAIYVCGLDLSYPDKKTHITGSTFEEAIHRSATLLSPAEKSVTQMLFSATTEWATDFDDNPVLTDQRMKLFAWWFESKIADTHTAVTYTLNPKGIRIPGMVVTPVDTLLAQNDKKEQKEAFWTTSEQHQVTITDIQYQNVLTELKKTLDDLYHIAKKGQYECNAVLEKQNPDYEKVFSKLEQIDTTIRMHKGKDAVSLIFPTEKKLNSIMQGYTFSDSPHRKTLQQSRIIYEELCHAITEYQNAMASI